MAKLIIFLLFLTTYFCISHGCTVVGANWPLPVSGSVLDTYRGVFLDMATIGIDGIESVNYGAAINNRQYVDFNIINSRLVISTNPLFDEYEENETALQMQIAVTFRCSDGSSPITYNFFINVVDTNNNAPQFWNAVEGQPRDEFEFTVTAPLPPGFKITGCLNDLIVRDIDLTTSRIDFAIEDNEYFEIEYGGLTIAKEFQGILKTKTLIRSIPEPITLTISATDVDATGDPPITTKGKITIIGDGEFEMPEEPVFTKAFYLADYTEDNRVVLEETISLRSGYHSDVDFSIEGEFKNNFEIVPNPQYENQMSIGVTIPLTGDVLDQPNVLLAVKANREHTSGASATVVVRLPQGIPLEFERAHYEGTIENNILDVPPLILTQGYEGTVVSANVISDYTLNFNAVVQGNTITLSMTPLAESIINENGFIYLQIVASTDRSITTTVVTLEIIKDDNITPVFNQPIYTGSYNPGADLSIEQISFTQGYDGIDSLDLFGDNSNYFTATQVGASVRITVSTIPPALYSLGRIVLSLEATKPRTVGASATLIINLPGGSSNGNVAEFENVFYEGVIQGNDVRHELVRIFGYDGTTVDVIGDYSSLFMARALDGVVTVGASGTLNLPDDVTRVVLELQAAGARTAMVLNVEQSDAPILPTVTFSSETYEITVGIAQTGLIGRVSATTTNGEAVTYSLGTLNAHLQTRLSINNEGELYLSAPANSGVYTFQVVATSVITQATGTATVTLSVEAVTVCEDGEIVVPPLIIIDRDEEQAHRNLVVLDPEQQSGCHYTMTHRWPTNANWLYVDENGLHANVIDREHPSIAFMALSQVQVELILHCENDNPGRSKRSERTDWLGPYDYGTNKWILTDTILYNSRRSLVNLIVNDINDNDPIFVGKEHEPIVVGYPTDELEERILPRSLVELKATDADVGENAQLMYSSAESSLAVAPTTGFVHVRSGATLVQDQILTVRATDQNGNGRTGTIQLMVKLLDLSHIAVVTVRDAFLDDETTVLNQLSAAVGYEVKSLRSVVISDDIDGDVTRKTREANNGGASLQLYVYGLIAREPVVVERLTTDISTNAANVNVISTLTLQDHLEDMYIFERDIGLLVATIVLSVLLFMLIVVIAIWFFLRWRKSKKYNELSEENSIASRNSSLGEVPKPEPMKPRLNIEDLKRSEKRLQERLEAPIEEISVEPMTSRKLESPVEAILDVPVPEVIPPIPIVIQSIDKLKDADDDDDTDDEFGEVTAPRKSVVTFNENVEKIITVEDDAEDDGDSSRAGYEVYRL